MDEQQYIDILEATFINFLMDNFESKISVDTSLQLLEILESMAECGYSAQDAMKYMIKRHSGEN